mmetsp:Transcript_6870/g.12704  ORF Transcript_6870/g.12704 Transcript_6870/m.12704 type:complete len:226 (+) Transcript_6870:159-836(+)
MLLDEFSNAKCHLKRLRTVETGVAKCGVAERQVLFRNTSTHTFCNVVSGKLKVHTSQVVVVFRVNPKTLFDLLENVIERPSLVARCGCGGVSVARVRDPENREAGGLHRFDQRREHRRHVACPKACNQRDLSWSGFGVRPDRFDELDQLVRLAARPNLNPNGVGDATHVFNMGMVELTSAVSDPEKVGPQVEVAAISDSFCHGLFVCQVERLVGLEHVYAFKNWV